MLCKRHRANSSRAQLEWDTQLGLESVATGSPAKGSDCTSPVPPCFLGTNTCHRPGKAEDHEATRVTHSLAGHRGTRHQVLPPSPSGLHDVLSQSHVP